MGQSSQKTTNLLVEFLLTFVLVVVSFIALSIFIYHVYILYTGITGNFIPEDLKDTGEDRILFSCTLLFVTGIVLYMVVPALKDNILPRFRQAIVAYRLIGNNGIKIRATVIDTEETGLFENNLPEFRFSLEYSVPGYEKKFKGSLTKVLGYGELHQAHAGCVEILYDPKNPKKISWARITEWK